MPQLLHVQLQGISISEAKVSPNLQHHKVVTENCNYFSICWIISTVSVVFCFFFFSFSVFWHIKWHSPYPTCSRRGGGKVRSQETWASSCTSLFQTAVLNAPIDCLTLEELQSCALFAWIAGDFPTIFNRFCFPESYHLKIFDIFTHIYTWKDFIYPVNWKQM